jgi:hypothetical protein
MTLEELAARIQVLEDIEPEEAQGDVRLPLRRRAGGRAQPGALLDHFTDDARVDFGLGAASVFEGREGLRTFFGTVVPQTISFCVHMVHNPIIEVHGDRATGRWYYEAPTTDVATNRAQWMMGTYEEEYVRDGGRWKFSFIRARWKYITPYDEGWARNRGELLAALAEAKP